MNMNYGKVRMVNCNSSCCRPLQGDLRERERDALSNWFILQWYLILNYNYVFIEV